ncbi:hypothetical protein VVD49_13470 [Uliginosibacterium sp. H3]|uniref:Uncharacterized protein n=1 Tax=Uliginosibacterium silvisoli TaxID=3114758 RepID=A0ABU6K4L7_9RHOO|nr:hypothetical protein [Uliginosibacterium sp. H3]
MKFQSQVKVLGMKSSSGEFEGVKYDATKVYVETALDSSKGMASGFGCLEYSMGNSTEYAKYKHLEFPFMGMAEMEIITSGKQQKTVMHSVKPTDRVKA